MGAQVFRVKRRVEMKRVVVGYVGAALDPVKAVALRGGGAQGIIVEIRVFAQHGGFHQKAEKRCGTLSSERIEVAMSDTQPVDEFDREFEGPLRVADEIV